MYVVKQLGRKGQLSNNFLKMIYSRPGQAYWWGQLETLRSLEGMLIDVHARLTEPQISAFRPSGETGLSFRQLVLIFDAAHLALLRVDLALMLSSSRIKGWILLWKLLPLWERIPSVCNFFVGIRKGVAVCSLILFG